MISLVAGLADQSRAQWKEESGAKRQREYTHKSYLVLLPLHTTTNWQMCVYALIHTMTHRVYYCIPLTYYYYYFWHVLDADSGADAVSLARAVAPPLQQHHPPGLKRRQRST